MMPYVTGMGCTATAICGAFLAVNPNPAQAAAHAMALLNLAGEQAGKKAHGPGDLKACLFNAIYHLDARTVEERYGH